MKFFNRARLLVALSLTFAAVQAAREFISTKEITTNSANLSSTSPFINKKPQSEALIGELLYCGNSPLQQPCLRQHSSASNLGVPSIFNIPSLFFNALFFSSKTLASTGPLVQPQEVSIAQEVNAHWGNPNPGSQIEKLWCGSGPEQIHCNAAMGLRTSPIFTIPTSIFKAITGRRIHRLDIIALPSLFFRAISMIPRVVASKIPTSKSVIEGRARDPFTDLTQTEETICVPAPRGGWSCTKTVNIPHSSASALRVPGIFTLPKLLMHSIMSLKSTRAMAVPSTEVLFEKRQLVRSPPDSLKGFFASHDIPSKPSTPAKQVHHKDQNGSSMKHNSYDARCTGTECYNSNDYPSQSVAPSVLHISSLFTIQYHLLGILTSIRSALAAIIPGSPINHNAKASEFETLLPNVELTRLFRALSPNLRTSSLYQRHEREKAMGETGPGMQLQ